MCLLRHHQQHPQHHQQVFPQAFLTPRSACYAFHFFRTFCGVPDVLHFVHLARLLHFHAYFAFKGASQGFACLCDSHGSCVYSNASRSCHAFRVLLAHAFAFRAPHGPGFVGLARFCGLRGKDVFARVGHFLCFVRFGIFCAVHPTSCVSLVSGFVGLLCTSLIRTFREAPAPPCPLRAFWCVSWVF